MTDLEIGDAIRVDQLVLDKVKILTDLSQSRAIVRAPRVVEEEEVVVEEEEGAEPEVVGEKKDEEAESGGSDE